MRHFDVFNGDADGICALVQKRLDQPVESTLVTGLKREIDLLKQVEAQAGDVVTVLDVSLRKNREALDRILREGASVEYIDHHEPGPLPTHANLEIVIDTDPRLCTSLLVNKRLDGRHAEWAVVGAFGDNLQASARALVEGRMDEGEVQQLRTLGKCLNYNSYGGSPEDVLMHPRALFSLVRHYARPRDFIADNASVCEQLTVRYHDDMEKAATLTPHEAAAHAAVFFMPDEAWARRAIGEFGYALMNEHPNRAHALISAVVEGACLVSVRAPLAAPTGAYELCRDFPTGGGRNAAAGINKLPAEDVERFVSRFMNHFRRP